MPVKKTKKTDGIQTCTKTQSKRKAPRTAFKKGQSGNPAGRPKTGNTWGDLLEMAMAAQDKELKGKTIKEAIAIKAAEKAREGNPVFLDMIMKRQEGNPSQPITGDEGGPLEVVNMSMKEFKSYRKKVLEEEDV